MESIKGPKSLSEIIMKPLEARKELDKRQRKLNLKLLSSQISNTNNKKTSRVIWTYSIASTSAMSYRYLPIWIRRRLNLTCMWNPWTSKRPRVLLWSMRTPMRPRTCTIRTPWTLKMQAALSQIKIITIIIIINSLPIMLAIKRTPLKTIWHR